MKLLNSILSLSLIGAALPFISVAQSPRPDAAEQSPSIVIVRSGSQPSQQAPAEHFTGSVRIAPLFGAKAPSRASGGSVTFDAGARSAWHTHPLGQVLIVTAGAGWIQSWGGPIQEMRQGDIVRIPPGVKHWHGASATSSVTHTAIQEEIDGRNVDWLEKVSDDQYGPAPSTSQEPEKTQAANDMNKEPSAIKKTFGDFSPKLVQLTDDVLFGDGVGAP
jgi:4-carboxymuconolactone decarboxylase